MIQVGYDMILDSGRVLKIEIHHLTLILRVLPAIILLFMLNEHLIHILSSIIRMDESEQWLIQV